MPAIGLRPTVMNAGGTPENPVSYGEPGELSVMY
jgi:hypothetical protein